MSGNFIYRRQLTVEWGHCDPAGIVFNSRFFEFFDWNAWSMFGVALGVRPGDFEKVFGIMGLPVVDAKARFLAPAKFNDVLEIASEVTEFRRSSFERPAPHHHGRANCGRRQRDTRVGRLRPARPFEDQKRTHPGGCDRAVSGGVMLLSVPSAAQHGAPSSLPARAVVFTHLPESLQ